MGNAGDWIELAPQGVGSRIVIHPKSLMTNWEEIKPSIVFECRDIQAAFESLKASGVEFVNQPKKMAWGTYAKFRDLDGNESLLKGP